MIAHSLRLGVGLVLAYRLEVAVQICSASIVIFLNWSIWTAICEGRGEVAGRSPVEMTTYVVVAWVITTFYSTRIDEFIGARIRSGDIAIDLLRPWSLQAHLYLRELGRSAALLAFTTLPLALWTTLLLPLRLPQRASTWALFAVSLFFAQAISYSLSWLVGLVALRLRNAVGLARLKATLIAIFSGALIPLDLYPEPLRGVVLALPLAGLSHVPAQLFIEGLPAARPWQPLALQVGWALALPLIGAWAFRRVCRTLVVQGG